MSNIERFLYWIAIVVLIVAIIGVKGNISKLEQVATQVSSQVEE
ncbi:hypothetical protein [Hydrogenothermus marinus]|uniref:Uncharacterized protein n=1 Tax=Hydrogenothermus marinus TaxID=133270 RepID=A0A3M0BMV3_9AQUI|nr:hypothetical protein [Hydrogenothermus marinus]RMA96148.1 hypothetical protein CLV39_1162 [Hydrogenothermus marinus]